MMVTPPSFMIFPSILKKDDVRFFPDVHHNKIGQGTASGLLITQSDSDFRPDKSGAIASLMLPSGSLPGNLK
ncbi:hypothetical protein JW906_16375 [bacterium]|nr:hypothetical protein [bacterium]